jgi:uridine monophosphate synthetase
MYKEDLELFMDSLYEIGSVKFGEFYLSTGLKTPVYFDLRIIVSHPKVLVSLNVFFWLII